MRHQLKNNPVGRTLDCTYDEEVEKRNHCAPSYHDQMDQCLQGKERLNWLTFKSLGNSNIFNITIWILLILKEQLFSK